MKQTRITVCLIVTVGVGVIAAIVAAASDAETKFKNEMPARSDKVFLNDGGHLYLLDGNAGNGFLHLK